MAAPADAHVPGFFDGFWIPTLVWQILLLAGVVFIAWVLRKLAREDNGYQFEHLLMDSSSDGILRASRRAHFEWGAFAISSWGFVYLIIDQRFSEWYFTGYMGAWVLYAWLKQRESNDMRKTVIGKEGGGQ